MNKVILDFYQNPKLCKDYMHKIDFLCEDDKYNPFSSNGHYAKAQINIDDELYNALIELLINQDLGIERDVEIEKTNTISSLIFSIILVEMEKQKIEFKRSSKYFLQTAFMKMTVKYINSIAIFFFQLLGISRKKKIILTNVFFLKNILQSTPLNDNQLISKDEHSKYYMKDV